MRIVDTHLHLVYLDRFAYPWLQDAPAINHQNSAEDYFAKAEALGIEKALHMEVDVAEKDMYAESEFIVTAHPRIAGAIAAGRPEHEDFAAYLDRIAAIDGVKGMRRVLHTSPDALSQSETFAANLRRLPAYGLTFDLCLRADQLPLGAALVAKCENVQFILDHCGVPDIAGGGLDPWRADIRKMAEFPNVTAKISGIIAYAGADWTVDMLRPYAEHVIESFGWDRVVWGSDYPVCTMTADLEAWVEATHEIISGTSDTEKQKLLSANAERIFNI